MQSRHQRLPQALTNCDPVPVSPGAPCAHGRTCAAEAAARGRFLRSCNATYAFSSNSGLGRVVRFRLVVVTTKSALVFFTPADAITTSDLVVNIAREVSDAATSRAAHSASPFASRVEVLHFLHSVFRGLARFRDATPCLRASHVHHRSGFTSSDVDGVRRDDGGPQPQGMQLTRNILHST